MHWACKNYPACDSYVRVHPGTNVPMGVPANWKLRKLRNEAHHYFNQLYKRGYMTKQDAYCWLADILCVPFSQAHIISTYMWMTMNYQTQMRLFDVSSSI